MARFDLSIKNRLVLGYVVLTAITVIMGVFGIFELRKQSATTESMYRHPLIVSNTVRDIRTAIITMHRNMKDVVLSEDPARISELSDIVDQDEQRILTAYDVLKDRFLGDKTQVDEARRAFVAWRDIRDHVFTHMRDGEVARAIAITQGNGADHVNTLNDLNQVLSDFASFKADEFYADARQLDQRALALMFLLLGILVLASVVVAVVIAKSVTDPLQTVCEGVSVFATGQLDQRIELGRNDEIGYLAEALNTMAAELGLSTTSVNRLNEEIRERELAEERASNLGQVLEESLNEVYILDAESFKFIRANRGARENLGYTAQEIAELTPLDLCKDFTRDRFSALIKPLLDGQVNRLSLLAVHTRKDGSTYPVDVDLQGAIFGGHQVFIALIMDITVRQQFQEERAALESKVQHAQKLESLGVLAGGIAHDFNNILMTILGNATLAIEDTSPTSPVRENLSDIETAAKRAADLCRQMLAYSGKGQFVISALDLSEVVSETGRMLEVSISKKAILKFNLQESLPLVRGDATQIRQVILNLITNASDAIGKRSGIISITTGAKFCDAGSLQEAHLDGDLTEGYYVYIEISDTGCGMDETTQRRMFDPFFTTKFTGRGLGMAAVLGIIRGHGGAIRVYSEESKGTTIKVLLPVSEEADLPQFTELAKLPVHTQGGTVLLVDDEETIRTVGRRILERMGYQVLLANDGLAGVELLRQHAAEVTVVLLDLTMPHLSGQEAFREMRRIRKDIPIILSSGYNEQEVTQEFVGRGLAGFLQKPYQPHELAAKLNEVLGHKEPDPATP